ncbi:hypothetical protein GCM10018790_63190 [Kitasatospora xanthocidica]|nr:hypothetical protein GCM10018790_63190 [Kitasatospora xanthocidica]
MPAPVTRPTQQWRDDHAAFQTRDQAGRVTGLLLPGGSGADRIVERAREARPGDPARARMVLAADREPRTRVGTFAYGRHPPERGRGPGPGLRVSGRGGPGGR